MNVYTALLKYRDETLERRIEECSMLSPHVGYITLGPSYPMDSYARSGTRPEDKIPAVIYRILDDDFKPSKWCFAIYLEDGEIHRRWTLYSWATFGIEQIPEAITHWIESTRPAHPVQLGLFA